MTDPDYVYPPVPNLDLDEHLRLCFDRSTGDVRVHDHQGVSTLLLGEVEELRRWCESVERSHQAMLEAID